MALEELFFSVDVEASGPIPAEYSLLSIGCAVVGRPEATFYAELKPINSNAVPEALKVAGLDMETLRAKGEEPAAAMKRFATWIKETCGATHRPVFAAFNATFDWMFVHWYFVKYTGGSPFSISGLDMKAYYMGMMGTGWGGTKKEHVTKKFPTKAQHTHNALDDAKEQAELFGQMREYQKLRKG